MVKVIAHLKKTSEKLKKYLSMYSNLEHCSQKINYSFFYRNIISVMHKFIYKGCKIIICFLLTQIQNDYMVKIMK